MQHPSIAPKRVRAPRSVGRSSCERFSPQQPLCAGGARPERRSRRLHRPRARATGAVAAGQVLLALHGPRLSRAPALRRHPPPHVLLDGRGRGRGPAQPRDAYRFARGEQVMARPASRSGCPARSTSSWWPTIPTRWASSRCSPRRTRDAGRSDRAALVRPDPGGPGRRRRSSIIRSSRPALAPRR
jgi:hypothetical protein